MLRLLRRTLLYQRTTEVWDAYRALKRAEHRAALKLKRATVRSRVLHELQRAQIEQTVLKMETARTTLRIHNAQELATTQEKRNKMLREALAMRGQSIPELSSSVKSSSKESSETSDGVVGAFKKRMVTEVESLLPPVEDGGPGRRMASDILRETVNSIPLGDEQEQADMSVKLITGVARDAGVEWKDMERLIAIVEKNEEKREELTRILKEAMVGEEKVRQGRVRETGT